MAEPNVCLGHGERGGRRNKINKLLTSSQQTPYGNLRVLIKMGPVSEELSLKELEKIYANKPEWKVVEEGGVLSIPVEEFRITNPQKNFGKAKKGIGTKMC